MIFWISSSRFDILDVLAILLRPVDRLSKPSVSREEPRGWAGRWVGLGVTFRGSCCGLSPVAVQ